jgi:hypothetical protein
VLSRRFRTLFLRELRRAVAKDPSLGAESARWLRVLDHLETRSWVVYAKPPFGGATQVLKYLARYTHRVAISNRRLVSLELDGVTFRWKDYAHGNARRTLTLDPLEFIWRFLLHVLPGGFVHIRRYGFLANRHRVQKLARCRALLAEHEGASTPIDDPAPAPTTPCAEPSAACPACGNGTLVLGEVLQPRPTGPPWAPCPVAFDTS